MQQCMHGMHAEPMHPSPACSCLALLTRRLGMLCACCAADRQLSQGAGPGAADCGRLPRDRCSAAGRSTMPRLACRPCACMHALLPSSQHGRTGRAGNACPIECAAHALPAVPAARADEVAMRGAIEVAGTTSTLVSAFLSKVAAQPALLRRLEHHAAATASTESTETHAA